MVKTVPIIFQTWAEKAKPENQLEMNDRYRKLAKNQDVLLAPVGEVWSAAKEELESKYDVDLYYVDGAHASAIGDYLVAMVLAKVIIGQLPSNDFVKTFDFSLPNNDWNSVKENVDEEIMSVPSEVAAAIRKYVSE